eukprot:4631113-Pyramimonas_sp.AAC.1
MPVVGGPCDGATGWGSDVKTASAWPDWEPHTDHTVQCSDRGCGRCKLGGQSTNNDEMNTDLRDGQRAANRQKHYARKPET